MKHLGMKLLWEGNMNTIVENGEYLGCCACPDESAGLIGGTGCADKKYMFTRREENVLNKIREASEKARAVKEKIRNLARNESSPVLMEEALGELERLRQIRDELEIERIAAAEERMRMLGHL
jgi:hypothetical protein